MQVSMAKCSIVTSIFTREKGYVNLKTSGKINKKKAIEILNSFTPQGASPKGSVRIGTFGNSLGVGYYWMENPSVARITTILTNFSPLKYEIFSPPLDEKQIPILARGVNLGSELYVNSSEFNLDYWIEKFGKNSISAILYSYLSGDNMLIVHEDPNVRLNFLKILTRLVPSLVFKYNRITSGCSELDGNENIVGVNKLPKKYRSHKKLFLPLDTVFIDLNTFTIEGEGIKKSEFTSMIIDVAETNYYNSFQLLISFLKKINQRDQNITNLDESGMSLVSRIQSKLGLKPPLTQEWIMF